MVDLILSLWVNSARAILVRYAQAGIHDELFRRLHKRLVHIRVVLV